MCNMPLSDPCGTYFPLPVVTQQGNQFTWTVAIGDEKGEGTISGNNMSAFWKGMQGSGSSAGQIMRESAGKATEIKWNNGVRFYRE